MIGILWRGDRRDPGAASNRLFEPLAKQLAALGVTAEPVVYADDALSEVRAQLLRLRGVLVWVDPIASGRTRAQLDPLLREVSSLGVWVSAHPDVILKMGTKEVLHRTRGLGWGSDTRVYRSPDELRAELPRALASGARVLKQNRGNGGNGVFRVELAGPGRVRVQHALRGSAREELGFAEFARRCDGYLADGGPLVDQAFQPRHAEGMVRCYLVQDRVAGFGHQKVTALMDPAPGEAAPPAPPPRLYCGPATPEFQALRARLESEWVPEMQRILDLRREELPLLWDADFLLGPHDASGADTHVLCEINVSAVYPFPEEALEPLARAAAARLTR